jgi:phytol kinase
MRSIVSVAVVLGLLGGLMAGVRLAQIRGAVGPELSRKLVHVGMGTLCLAFPWIFASPGPVWALAGCAVIGLLALRLVAPLRAQLGSVLGGVGRASLGEVYFPVAVALIFTLAGSDRAAFCAPVAILTYADAAGALVGRKWGRTRYRAVESMKTLEGSAAVFGVTWVAVMVIVAAWGRMPWAETVLAGVIIGAFAALVEAVSWRGLDNLLVPLVAFAQMRIYPHLGWPELTGRAVVMALLVGAMLNWRKRLLDSSARLGAGLTLYLFWSLGDWRWLVAPGVLIASYSRLMPTIPGGPERHYLAAVLCIGSAGIGWAVANAWVPDERWLWLFTVGLAAQQAIIAVVRFSQGRPRWRPWQWWLVAVAQAVGVQTIAFGAVNGPATVPAGALAAGAAAVALALAGFMVWDRDLALPEDLNARWWRQGVTAVLASAAGFVFMAQ